MVQSERIDTKTVVFNLGLSAECEQCAEETYDFTPNRPATNTGDVRRCRQSVSLFLYIFRRHLLLALFL